MKKNVFGQSGCEVSEVGLGCWQLGSDCWGDVSEERAMEILRAAIESGVTFLDTADVYGSGRSEQLIGRFLQECSEDIFVTTKLGRGPGTFPDRYTRESLTAATESSLRNLGVETLDLTQLHCVPLEVLRDGEIFTIMNELQQAGKIRHWGASVESIEQADACIDAPGLASFQIIFNIFRQNPIEDLFARVRERNIAIIVRLPMSSGALAGKYTGDEVFARNDHRNFNANGAMFSVGETFSGIPFKKAVELANELRAFCPSGMTMAQFAMRWILDYPEVSVVIPGASRVEQVESNASASALPPLPEETHAALETFYCERVHEHIRGIY